MELQSSPAHGDNKGNPRNRGGYRPHPSLRYKTLVSAYGNVYTPDILDAVVEQNLDLPDVQNIILPREALEDTRLYVGAGMPEGYFGFGSDSGGSMFRFSLEDLSEGTGDSAVWFFDHDFVDMTRESDSFLEWLRIYVEIREGRTVTTAYEQMARICVWPMFSGRPSTSTRLLGITSSWISFLFP